MNEKIPNSSRIGELWQRVKGLLSKKQDTLTGKSGQVVGFDSDGAAIAQDAPNIGVLTFNGRTGAVISQKGDYTAEMIGALSTSGGEINGSLHVNSSLTIGEGSDSIEDTKVMISYSDNADGSDPAIYLQQLGAYPNEEFTGRDIGIGGVATPLWDTYAANKKYVDNIANGKLDKTATAAAATKLESSKTIQVNLATTTAVGFDGTTNITPGVTGTLPVGRGGTNKTSWTAYRLIYPSASTTFTQLAFPSVAGSVLRQGTSGAPYWTSLADLATALSSAGGGGLKIESGEYAGSGHASGFKLLKFSFTPKVLIVVNKIEGTLKTVSNYFSDSFIWIEGVERMRAVSVLLDSGSTNSSHAQEFKVDGTSIVWSTTASSYPNVTSGVVLANAASNSYIYTAIG